MMETSLSQPSESDQRHILSGQSHEQHSHQPASHGVTPDNVKEKQDGFNIDNLRSQKLHIPNLWPAFEGWKRGVNTLYYPLSYPETCLHFGDLDTIDGKSRLRRSVDFRLGQLFRDDPDKLEKAKAVDIGLFASCLFPDVPYEILETAAFYCIWLFFWDDAIDGHGTAGDSDLSGTVEAGREYCRKSVSFISCCLALPERYYPVDCPAPTEVCASFEDVADRVRDAWKKGLTDDLDLGRGREIRSFQRNLEKYMNACVVEQAWRLSSLGSQVPPFEEEFWGWRLGTSSVDAFLDLSVILNKVSVPWDIQQYVGESLGLLVNKLLVCINELFSLKKELKDKTGHMNLIPITMAASPDPTNLDAAVNKIVKDIYSYAAEFNIIAMEGRSRSVIASPGFRGIPLQQAQEQFNKMVAAYQTVVTAVLHFSIESPRYGILKDRLPEEEGGGFLVTL